MAVSIEVSVDSDSEGKPGLSNSKRLTNSAAKSWASAALPPLPLG